MCSFSWARFSKRIGTTVKGIVVQMVTPRSGHWSSIERDLAELLDVAPMTLDNIYNVIDQKNGALRVHFLSTRCCSTPNCSRKCAT